MIIRQLEENDWTTIDWLASNDVQEGDHSKYGSQWGQFRRSFEGERVDSVLESGGEVVAYVALEREAANDDWRAFIVLDWSLQDSQLQEAAYQALESLIESQAASSIWMREMSDDFALIEFVQRKGFVIEQRYTLEGLDMVNLRRTSEA